MACSFSISVCVLQNLKSVSLSFSRPIFRTFCIFKYTNIRLNKGFLFLLHIQEVFGDYQFNNYDVKKSPRLIMIAKKVVK